MFGGPAWAFADAYCAHAPTPMYRFDHFGFSLRMLGLSATHGSEIVHVQHSYASYLGRKTAPAGSPAAALGRQAHAARVAGLLAHRAGRQVRSSGRAAGPLTTTPSGADPGSSGRPRRHGGADPDAPTPRGDGRGLY